MNFIRNQDFRAGSEAGLKGFVCLPQRHNQSKNRVFSRSVGGYRLFGLPNAAWNWRAMFLGNASGKGEANTSRDWLMRLNSLWNDRGSFSSTPDNKTEMVLISKHDEPCFTAMKSQIERIAKELTYINKVRYGFMSGKYYIRLEGESRGIYVMTAQTHICWRLVTDLDGTYYLLNTNNETMLPIGSRNPWTYYVDLEHCTVEYHSLSRHTYSCEQVLKPIRRKDYLSSESSQNTDIFPKAGYVYRHTRFLPYMEENNPKFHTKQADVMNDKEEGEKVIFNKNQDVIMRCTGKVELLPDNLAFVDGKYVNLYTMQAFDQCPQVVKAGFIDLLKDGDNFYFQKVRYMSYIPLKECQFKFSSDVFQFMDKYIVRRAAPQTILRLDFARKESYKRIYHMVSLEMDGKENVKGEIDEYSLPYKG